MNPSAPPDGFDKDERMRRIRLVALAAAAAFGLMSPAVAKAAKGSDAVLKLADLPKDFVVQAADTSKSRHKCLNWTQAINKGSSSAVRNTFGTDSEVVIHAVAVHPSAGSASAGFAGLKALVASCSSFAYKLDGSTLKVSFQPMNLTTSVKPDEFFAWKYAVKIGPMTVSSTVVLYRKETTVGFLANGGVFPDLDVYKLLLAKAIQRA